MTGDARLGTGTLGQLPQTVLRPGYDRSALRPGVLHLGLGAFHRAHQAIATDTALATGDPRWGIAAVAMRSHDLLERLRAQDGLYSVLSGDGEKEEIRIVGALCRLWHLQADRARIMGLSRSPDLHVVTLTVTEKGYGHIPATGQLNRDDPDVAHDLAHGVEDAAPAKSVVGLLADLIALRAGTGLPLTVLCCDNMERNGHTLRRLVEEMLQARAPDTLGWLSENVRFPNAMVDRIVPAETDATRAAAAAKLGLTDLAPLATETFTQWVIENDFAAARPDWESAGVTFVEDIAPWQRMKLALLNGPHSAIAYTGQILGLETVDAAMGDGDLATFVRDLMVSEIRPAIETPAGANTHDYIESLLRRFSNPGLHHRTEQIAMDGSQKIPVRWIPVIEASLARGHVPERLCLTVAAWIHYLSLAEAPGMDIKVNDPMAPRLSQLLAAHETLSGAAKSILDLQDIFPARLSAQDTFCRTVLHWVDRIDTAGLRTALRDLSFAASGQQE